MSRRHTLTSPEQRRLPRRGRYRLEIRLAVVSRFTDEETGELLYPKEDITDDDGNVIVQRANRQTRRAVAWGTRLHANGKPWQQPPISKRQLAATPRTKVDDEVTDDEWDQILTLGRDFAGFKAGEKVKIS